MPKLLKMTKHAIQTRNRVRMYRGIKSIMANDSKSLLNVNSLREKLKINKVDERIQFSNEKSNSHNDLRNDLRTWAIEKNINKRAVTALLKILRSAGMNFLPKDSRSLVETPRQVDIVNLANGKYWHNGLDICLTEIFSQLSMNLCIELNINIDGLPLFKSSPVVLWPILANIHGEYCKYLIEYTPLAIYEIISGIGVE